jgi:hypothetical protein
MELEVIMLSEISQIQKDTYCMMPKKVNLIAVETRMVVTRTWEQEGWRKVEEWVLSYRSSKEKNKRF